MAQPRILVVHPSAELYGSDRVLLESVTGFLAHGAHVDVVLAAGGPLQAQIEARGASVTIESMPVLRKSMLRPRALPALLAAHVSGLVRGIRLVRQLRPSVVYVSTLTIPLWNAVARLARVPLVVHVHEAERSAGRLLRAGLVAPLRLASLIVFNSRYAQATVEMDYPRASAKSRVVYNGVVGPATTTPARRSLDGGLRLVYVGRLSARKGPDVLVEAMARARHSEMLTLTLIGAVFAGYERFEQQLRARIAELGLTNRVRLEGFQPSGYPYLAEGDVAVVPSTIDEPFGNTAVEAMLAARPAIVSDTSGLREAGAGYGSVVFVPPADADALAAAIDHTVDEWATLAERARVDADRAEERHALSAYNAQMWAAVQRFLPAVSQRRGLAVVAEK
ncbi:glycosyltransferase [Agreia sp.]|uniref:glycosyltransferase n=1 Tax=Agreia sp. TaxID=1872416 RepID=UPI0035BC574B